MDFHFENNTIKIMHQNKTFNLHPIWLRERLPGEKYFDLDTNQRLYEPSSIAVSYTHLTLPTKRIV